MNSVGRNWKINFARIELQQRSPYFASRILLSRMSSSSKLTLPCQPDDPVDVVAAPGISPSQFKAAVDSSLFNNWLNSMQSGILANTNASSMSLRQVLIQGIDLFGDRVGFLKFKADLIDNDTGTNVPGIVFARGPAVAVLILLESEDDTYAILTEQARVPVGRRILELPAGMLDDDKGDFVGTAVREVEEEIGIHLNVNDMVDLTALLEPSTGRKVFPSPGGCDEEISLFLHRERADKETIRALQGKQTGLREHGELIKVHVVPYKRLWQMTADAKTLSAIALYEMGIREGLLPLRKRLTAFGAIKFQRTLASLRGDLSITEFQPMLK